MGLRKLCSTRPKTAAPQPIGAANCRLAPAIEVEFAGEARVRIPASIPTALAAAVVKALV